MAKRPYYYVAKNQRVCEKDVDFVWHSGLSASQKKKNVEELHKASGMNLLEVSTKSNEPLGEKLSAFRLPYRDSTVENYYQAGKIFENGGPYEDLIHKSPKEAKRDERLKESGKIAGFYDYETGETWYSSAFYYFLYINAVRETLSEEEIKQLVSYDGYTDIEFNPATGMNTQAKACAMIKLLVGIFGDIPKMNKDEFERIYQNIMY